MKKISIKLTNSQMNCLIAFLSHANKFSIGKTNEDHRLVTILMGNVLYDFRIVLAAKYARYTTKPTFAFQLTRAQAAALIIYYKCVQIADEAYRAIIYSIISTIDPQL